MTTFEAIQIKNELFDDAEDLSKCGEIFICNRGNFTFSCYFCTQRFTIYEEFIGHIQESHYKLILQDTNENDVTNIVEDAIIKEESVFETANPSLERAGVENNNQDSSTTKQDKIIPDPIFYSEVNLDHGKLAYKCGECGKAFLKKAGMVIHARKHRNKENSTTSDSKIKENGTSDSKPNEGPFKCNDCECTYQSKSRLIAHKRIHTGEMPYECEICIKYFRTEERLNRHLKVHADEQSYKCAHCPIGFVSKRNLDDHIKRLHQNKCDLCDKQFFTYAEMKVHMRTHTDLRPFQCEICGAKFKTYSHFCGHKRSHETVRRYICRLCDKKFKTVGSLNEHSIIHTGKRSHVCGVCQAAFYYKNILKNHMKVHSGVREYVCDICQKAFTQSSGLYSHMKSHRD